MYVLLIPYFGGADSDLFVGLMEFNQNDPVMISFHMS